MLYKYPASEARSEWRAVGSAWRRARTGLLESASAAFNETLLKEARPHIDLAEQELEALREEMKARLQAACEKLGQT